MNIQQFAARCERAIGQTIIAEGLYVRLLRVVQGPLTLTMVLELVRPATRSALQRLLALGPTLATATSTSAVRVQQLAGEVLVELPLPDAAWRTPSARELAKHSQGLRVCIGLDAMRRPVCVDLHQHGACFWVGPSRRGKTQSIKSTLYALAQTDAKYVVLSQKRADWSSFEDLAGCIGVVSDPAESLSALTWLAETLRIRAKLGAGGHAHIVVVDDLLNLLSVQPGCAAPLAEISSMGAGLGIHLLAGTQEAGSKRGTGGAGVENNATARVLYKSSNASAGARAAGAGGVGLEALSGAKGDALLLLDGDGVRVATAFCDDADVLMLPAGATTARPWVAQPVCDDIPAWLRRPPKHQLPAPVQPVQPVVVASVDASDASDMDPVQPVQPVQPVETWPLAARRPLTPDESLQVRELSRAGASLNSLCITVYGVKSEKTFGWIKEALK